MDYQTLLVDWGLPALFLSSFLAATVLPVASEWLLTILLLNQTNPAYAVLTATTGNTLGSITTWAIGIWGGAWVIHTLLRISDAQRDRAERWYKKWGVWSLLLAWTPIVGDALCLVGGLLRVPLLPFALLVGLGKGGRYVLLAWITLKYLN